MRILSRYVLRQFIPLAGLSLLAFVTVFLVIDLTDRLSGFLDRNVDAGTIFSYYVYYVPYILVLVLPMAMLLASLFCIGDLARHRELTAMKAAGVSFYRIALPIQAFSVMVSIGVLVFSDQVVPRANRWRADIDAKGYERERLSGALGIRSKVVLLDRGGQVLSVGEYHPERTEGKQVLLDFRFDGRLSERVTAEEMRWTGKEWRFFGGDVRRFEGEQQRFYRFESMCPAGLTLRPEDLVYEVRSIEQMTGAELRAFIRRKGNLGGKTAREEVRLHLQRAFPFANFVMVLIGVPLASQIRRTGKPLQVGIGLLASFAYYGSIQAGRAIGWNGLIAPFWGGWGADILFLAIGMVLLWRTHR